MAFWHMKSSLCGCSLKTGTIVIAWIYFGLCVIPIGVTLLGAVPLLIIVTIDTPEKSTNEPPHQEVENFHDETIVDGSRIRTVEIRLRRASDDSPNEDWATSLPELYGISPETPDYTSLNDTWLGDHPRAERFNADPDITKILVAVTAGVLMILGIAGAFNGMLLAGAYRDRTALIGYWIKEQIVLVVIDVGILGVMIHYDVLPEFTTLTTLDLVTRIYCLLVVNSYHYNLKCREKSRECAEQGLRLEAQSF